MAVNLTQGAIESLHNGNTELKPVLQVVGIQPARSQNSAGSSERYQFLLSDGTHLQRGLLATLKNDLVKSGRLREGSVVQLTQFVCDVIRDRNIIIVVDLKLIRETCPTIGEPQKYHTGSARPPAQVPPSTALPGPVPVNYEQRNPLQCGSINVSRPIGSLHRPKMETSAQMQSYVMSSNNAVSVNPKPQFVVGNSEIAPHGGVASPQMQSYGMSLNNSLSVNPKPQFAVGNSGIAPHGAVASPKPEMPPQQQPSMYMNRGPVARHEAPLRVIPIAALNPYQGRWTIKARVTTKGELRHYNNARGDGKVFSFDLLDSDGGEIRVTCFNAVADQFYGQIEVGRVYLISKGTLKPSQKAFNHLHNDHEILLDTTSLVQPCFDDDCSIPQQQFNFRRISDVEGMESNSIVDLIGVVVSISPVSSITRKNGTETQKRTLHLKDMSGRSVELTLWGNFCNAEGQTLQSMYDSGKFPVLAIKSARVYEFNGKGVGTLSTTQLFVDPIFSEAQELKAWFDREGKNTPSLSISREITSMVKSDFRKTISQIKDEKLGTSEKPDWITVGGTMTFIKMDNFCYTACPILIGERQCSKKVTNNGDGTWRCDRCDQSVGECDYRYILQLQISDHTGLTWVTAFQECGEEILGISAKNLFNIKYEEQDEDKFHEIMRSACFKKYVLKLKVKEEVFSDEQRVKSTLVKAERVNFVSEHRFLLDTMDRLKSGGLGVVGTNSEVATPNIATNRSGTNNYGVGQNTVPFNRDIGHSIDRSGQIGNQYNPNSGQCYRCNNFGHFAKDCPGQTGAIPAPYGGINVGSGGYNGPPKQYFGGF